MTLNNEYHDKLPAYGTHVPVLKYLASHFKIENVLEFGCGVFSTITFLDKASFPDLKSLVSLESDAFWIDNILRMVGKDPRVKIIHESEKHFINSEKFSWVYENEYDLSLIDGARAEFRVSSLLSAVPCSKILIAHDTENSYWDLCRHIPGFKDVTVTSQTPWTTIFIREEYAASINFDGLLQS